MMVDPDGEFVVAAMIIGAVIGAYIGGSSVNGWEINPGRWDYSSGKTWAGMGIGAVVGAAGGYGFAKAAPVLAKTGFFTHFGTSGTIGAYSLTGAASGAAIGYGSGFAGGMIHSNGSWNYSHKSGMHGAKVGATIGAMAGAIGGEIAAYEPPKGYPSVNSPEKPKWEGPYYQGTEEEAKEMLLFSSKMYNVETNYWNTSKGYYFSPIQGNAYGYSWDKISMKLTGYNLDIGFKANTIKSAYRYTYFEKIGKNFYLSPNIFHRAKIYSNAHTHPRNSPPGSDDLKFSYFFGIPGVVFGWNGSVYRYGGTGYWK